MSSLDATPELPDVVDPERSTDMYPNALSLLLVSSLFAPPPTGGIEWQHGSFDAALRAAKTKSGLTLVYFWADGSEFSGKLYAETLNKPDAAKALDGIVCYNAKHSESTKKLFTRYKIRTLPTMLFVKPDGEAEDVLTGFLPLDAFTTEVARIKRAEGTRAGLQTALSKHDPKSEAGIDARWSLIGKLGDLGLAELATQHTEKIRKLDPDGNTRAGGQLKLNEMLNDIFGEFAALKDQDREEALRKADFSSVYAFAKSSKSQPVRFSAWSSLARIEANRKDYGAAKAAIDKSVVEASVANKARWCNAVARFVLNSAKDVSSKERKYAETLAQRAVRMTMKWRKQAQKTKKSKGQKSHSEEIPQSEFSDDTLADRLAVLAQVQDMNRKRTKARKSIVDALALAKDENLRKELLKLQEQIAKS